MLVAASREKDGSYAAGGLKASLKWLEKAQEFAPDLFEINMIEAFIYIYSGRLDDARIVLDYLEELDPSDYYILTAEAAYWRQRKKLKRRGRNILMNTALTASGNTMEIGSFF